jgi:glycosyltransferase involved in cell wall biosynthesis
MPALAAGPFCHTLGIACIDGMIQSGALEPNFTRLKRLGMASATLVVANTQAGLDAWGIDPNKGRVVYNGFDWARLESPPDHTTVDRDVFSVVMAARMVPVKDFRVVIRAARLLSGDAEGWRFILVGDGPERKRLIREASDLVSSGVVVFPRPGMEVLSLVRASDAGVLMTNPRLAFEGLSNSIMEYMALGLPVVCGNGGGNPELVMDGVTGFIIPPADADALAARLADLRADRARCTAMGNAGRERVLKEFSVETMVNNMLRVYDEALWKTHAHRART